MTGDDARPRFLFGAGRRQLARAIDRLASADPASVVDVARCVAQAPGFRHLLLAALEGLPLAATDSDAVGVVLAEAGPWTRGQRRRIAIWLHSRGVPGWERWLGDDLDFPAGPVPRAFGADRLARARVRFGRGTPACFHLDDEEIVVQAEAAQSEVSPDEGVAAALRVIARKGPAAMPLRLLARTACQQARWGLLAQLLREGYLDEHMLEPSVTLAWHTLAWDHLGALKAEVARRVPLVDSSRCVTPAALRFRAHQLWTRGDFDLSLDTLDDVVAHETQADPGVLYEQLMVSALSGRGRSDRAIRLLDAFQACASDHAELRWLALLTQPRSPVLRDVQDALRNGGELALPSTRSSLFGPVITHLHWHLAIGRRTEELTALHARLDVAEPRWREHLPFVERDYIWTVLAIRRAGTDAARLATLLSRLLVLPVQTRWIRVALEEMRLERRGELLVGDDGLPLPLGMLTMDLCCRTVEYMLADHRTIRTRDQADLCSGRPIAVIEALIRILVDQEV